MIPSLPFIEEVGREAPASARLFRDLQAKITAGWSIDHRPDGGHGPIHERGRTTPLGQWVDVAFAPTNFTASGGAVWTVPFAAFLAMSYTLIGQTCILGFYIETSTITTAAPASLMMTLPTGLVPARAVFSNFLYDDNGTLGTGMVSAPARGSTLTFTKNMRASANFSVSAAMSLLGEIAFSIT